MGSTATVWRQITAVTGGGWGTSRRRTGGGSPWTGPKTRPLLLTNTDPAPNNELLGTYQPLAQAPDPGSVLVLRYRARAERGRGDLSVYAGLPLIVPDAETGPAATLVRARSRPLRAKPTDPAPDRRTCFPIRQTPPDEGGWWW